MAKETKLTKNRQERLALQHELLAFSGCAGLRLFAAFVKLDQAYPPLKSPARASYFAMPMMYHTVSEYRGIEKRASFGEQLTNW